MQWPWSDGSVYHSFSHYTRARPSKRTNIHVSHIKFYYPHYFLFEFMVFALINVVGRRCLLYTVFVFHCVRSLFCDSPFFLRSAARAVFFARIFRIGTVFAVRARHDMARIIWIECVQFALCNIIDFRIQLPIGINRIGCHCHCWCVVNGDFVFCILQ